MTSQNDAIARAISDYIERQDEAQPGDIQVPRDVDLFALGYVDSVGVVALVAWLEEYFEVTLSDDELFDDEFASINGIATIIANATGWSA